MSSSTKPVASFADTLREQDEIFYTVFPQALSGNCTRDPDSFDFASIQDDDKPQFQQSYKGCLVHAPQLLFSQLSPSQSWFGGHLNPHHISGSWTFPTHGDAKSSNSPLSSYATTTPGTSQHSGKPPKSGFSTGIKTDPVDSQMTVRNKHISKGLPDEQLQGAKRPSRSKSSKHNGDRKPILACLFCRGRKIACGPPATGTGEKTCRQCQRRSLTCVYPSGSRRGMRKKKGGFNVPNS
ncbi:hypothetical protein M378DRAFT_401669 [Amanita muscaria Koide BX008]|uniref:Zn(2)-C6 fungal-type domain-containing protein n=1 Tax=Amanita muscaria (strain Koide BX008) TaxID=946122 RepID=A0A0C2SS76_AMAMK|nr:hypothetical protein M378DRAFT_401669 [Amanita muscaria Koide BX008]